jgi:glutamate-1-semialdehyde aminotransferase
MRASTGVANAFFAPTPVETYEQACASDHERYRRFARHLLEAGIHVIPRGLLYVSTEHDEEDLEQAREAVRRAAPRCGTKSDPAASGSVRKFVREWAAKTEQDKDAGRPRV